MNIINKGGNKMCRRPRKTFKKKSSAKKAARGKGVYKVKGGFRISKSRKRRRR